MTLAAWTMFIVCQRLKKNRVMPLNLTPNSARQLAVIFLFGLHFLLLMNTRFKGTKVPPTGRPSASARGSQAGRPKAKPKSKSNLSTQRAVSETTTSTTSSSGSTPTLAEPPQTSSKKRKASDRVTLTAAQYTEFQNFLSSGSKTPPTAQNKAQARAQKVAKNKGMFI